VCIIIKTLQIQTTKISSQHFSDKK